VMTNTHIESFHATAAPVASPTTCSGSFGGMRRLDNVPALVGRCAR
jgi:hypothetical protein